jgi:hypothetical protein
LTGKELQRVPREGYGVVRSEDPDGTDAAPAGGHGSPENTAGTEDEPTVLQPEAPSLIGRVACIAVS